MIQIIKRPILTEKSEKVKGIHNHYVFEVERTANKIEIRQAIEAMFGVKVEKVRTVTVRGKRRIRYTRRGIKKDGHAPGRKRTSGSSRATRSTSSAAKVKQTTKR